MFRWPHTSGTMTAAILGRSGRRTHDGDMCVKSPYYTRYDAEAGGQSPGVEVRRGRSVRIPAIGNSPSDVAEYASPQKYNTKDAPVAEGARACRREEKGALPARKGYINRGAHPRREVEAPVPVRTPAPSRARARARAPGAAAPSQLSTNLTARCGAGSHPRPGAHTAH